MQLRRTLAPKNTRGGSKRRRRRQAEQLEAERRVRHPMSTVKILRSEEELREAVQRAAKTERHLAQQVAGRALRYEQINGGEEVVVTTASSHTPAEDLSQRRMRRSA